MADRWSLAVDKLIKMTRNDELHWQPSNTVCERGGTTQYVGPAYIAIVDGKRIAVYEYKFQNFTDADEWFWDKGVTIEFVDDNYQTEWVWPSDGRRHDLLDSIRYQISSADDFLNRFLTEPAAG